MIIRTHLFSKLNNTLKFDATQSSSTTTVDDNIAVPDETEFKLVNDTSES